MSRSSTTVGFTGHRKLGDPALICQRITEALALIKTKAGTPLTALSSAAMGADTLFAEQVLREGLAWTLLLPFSKKDFFNPADFPGDSLARARQVFRRAARVIQTGNDSVGEEKRREAFVECSLCTVDECDVLIAVWDGQPGQAGGTGGAVAHARLLGRPLLWINAVTGETTAERLELLAHRPGPVDQPGGPVEIKQRFDEHNTAAKKLRPWAINLNVYLVGLHQLATFVAILALIWMDHGAHAGFDFAALFKVVALSVALALPHWLQKNNHEWTDHRLRAELIRCARNLWSLPNAVPVLDTLRLPSSSFDKLRAGLRQERLAHPPEAPSLEAFKHDYIRFRIVNQLGYFRDYVREAQSGHRWRYQLAISSTLAAIALGLFFVCGLIEHEKQPVLYNLLKMFSIGLPLLTAALLASIAAHDLNRRLARYTDMAVDLQRARRDMELAGAWPEVDKIVIDVERLLLFEIWEWYSVTRHSASH